MSIVEAFDAVIPARPVTPGPGTTHRTARTARAAVQAKTRTSVRTRVRRELRVVYLDAADSWIVTEATPSLKTLWATTYADRVPAGHRPFRLWCSSYRVVAVGVAAPLHAVLWLLVHPVRGPLTLLAAIAGTAAANL